MNRTTISDQFYNAWVEKLARRLFPHQESEEEQEDFTPEGRERVKAFLKEFARAVEG